MLGTRAIWHKGWKAATAVPAAPESWGDFHQQRWELFDTQTDPSECTDLAGRAPRQAARADRALVDGSGPAPGAAARVPRRDRDPGHRAATAHGPEVAVHLLPGRSRDPRVGGPQHPQPLLHDRRGGGHRRARRRGRAHLPGLPVRRSRLYLKDGKLKYAYNFVGELVQVVESDEPVPTGHVVLSATFDKAGDGMPTKGTLTLHIRDKAVGSGSIQTQPGKFGLGGGGLVVRTIRRGAGHRRLPGGAPVVVRRRDDRQGGHRHQRRCVRRPGEGGGGGVRAPVTPGKGTDQARRTAPRRPTVPPVDAFRSWSGSSVPSDSATTSASSIGWRMNSLGGFTQVCGAAADREERRLVLAPEAGRESSTVSPQ